MPQNEGDSGIAAPEITIDEKSLLSHRLSSALQEKTANNILQEDEESAILGQKSRFFRSLLENMLEQERKSKIAPHSLAMFKN